MLLRHELTWNTSKANAVKKQHALLKMQTPVALHTAALEEAAKAKVEEETALWTKLPQVERMQNMYEFTQSIQQQCTLAGQQVTARRGRDSARSSEHGRSRSGSQGGSSSE